MNFGGYELRSRKHIVYTKERLLRGGVRCFCCGLPVKYEQASVEHKWPKSLGGTDDIANLAISHSLCNSRRANGIFVGNITEREVYATYGKYKVTCPWIAEQLDKLIRGDEL